MATDATGYLVRGKPVRNGRESGYRKGVILASLTGSEVLVWWFRDGVASDRTVTAADIAGLKSEGDIWQLGSGRARQLSRDCRGFSRAGVLRRYLDSHADRQAKAGL